MRLNTARIVNIALLGLLWGSVVLGGWMSGKKDEVVVKKVRGTALPKSKLQPTPIPPPPGPHNDKSSPPKAVKQDAKPKYSATTSYTKDPSTASLSHTRSTSTTARSRTLAGTSPLTVRKVTHMGVDISPTTPPSSRHTSHSQRPRRSSPSGSYQPPSSPAPPTSKLDYIRPVLAERWAAVIMAAASAKAKTKAYIEAAGDFWGPRAVADLWSERIEGMLKKGSREDGQAPRRCGLDQEEWECDEEKWFETTFKKEGRMRSDTRGRASDSEFHDPPASDHSSAPSSPPTPKTASPEHRIFDLLQNALSESTGPSRSVRLRVLGLALQSVWEAESKAVIAFFGRVMRQGRTRMSDWKTEVSRAVDGWRMSAMLFINGKLDALEGWMILNRWWYLSDPGDRLVLAYLSALSLFLTYVYRLSLLRGLKHLLRALEYICDVFGKCVCWCFWTAVGIPPAVRHSLPGYSTAAAVPDDLEPLVPIAESVDRPPQSIRSEETQTPGSPPSSAPPSPPDATDLDPETVMSPMNTPPSPTTPSTAEETDEQENQTSPENTTPTSTPTTEAAESFVQTSLTPLAENVAPIQTAGEQSDDEDPAFQDQENDAVPADGLVHGCLPTYTSAEIAALQLAIEQEENANPSTTHVPHVLPPNPFHTAKYIHPTHQQHLRQRGQRRIGPTLQIPFLVHPWFSLEDVRTQAHRHYECVCLAARRTGEPSPGYTITQVEYGNKAVEAHKANNPNAPMFSEDEDSYWHWFLRMRKKRYESVIMDNKVGIVEDPEAWDDEWAF